MKSETIINIKNEQLNILDDIIFILNKISNEQYTIPCKMLSNNSLGKHFRHIFDFYNNFINGIAIKEVNYDVRERKDIFEKKRIIMIKEINKIKNTISKISANNDLNIFSNIENNTTIKTKTNIERELLFLHSHALHHLAIVIIVLINEFKMEIDYSLTKSTSTLMNTK